MPYNGPPGTPRDDRFPLPGCLLITSLWAVTVLVGYFAFRSTH